MKWRAIIFALAVTGFLTLGVLALWVVFLGGGSSYIARRQAIEERAVALLLLRAIEAAARNGDIVVPSNEAIHIDEKFLARLGGDNITKTVYNRDDIILQYSHRYSIFARSIDGTTQLIMKRAYSSESLLR